MGYGYGHTSSGRYALACDRCGTVGGVRKRPCPHKVLTDSARGPRTWLRYCPAPALCGECYRELGGLRGVHPERCTKGAAASQAEYDARQARLDAGESMVVAAWNGPSADVVKVRCHDGAEYLIPIREYQQGRGGFVTDYPNARRLED